MYARTSAAFLTATTLLFSTSGGAAMADLAQGAAPPAVAARPTAWSEAAPIVERLEDALPASLRSIPVAERPARWPAWLAGQRRALSARIAQGDVDSVVNLLLFGTSFTTQPRITAKRLGELNQRWNNGDQSVQETLARHYQQRAADLVAAAARRNAGERMLDVRRVLAEHGQDLSTEQGRSTAMDFLFASIARVRQEAAQLAGELEAMRRSGDTAASVAARSHIFRDRGLAADSSVLTQFAVERALCAMRERAVVARHAVVRIAIVGPGLDFADKQEGFDFYDPQSLQPFTAADSLIRCELSAADRLDVTTIDVSPRVNGHLRAARERASQQRTPYRLVLPWNANGGWTPDASAYWKRAGDRIGSAFAVSSPRDMPGVRARGVSMPAAIVQRLATVEASIVSDRLTIDEAQRFDLVLASNILVYYDRFEQTLALGSIASMLRPGGILLTNDAVATGPEIPLRAGGVLAVPFSGREGDGERMHWYIRAQ